LLSVFEEPSPTTPTFTLDKLISCLREFSITTPTLPEMSATLSFREEAPMALTPMPTYNPPTPTPVIHLPTPQPCQLLVTKLNDFDGKDYKLFHCQCMIYMMANRDNFVTSEDKILFILSYMKGGLAGQWAENKYEKIMEDRYVTTTLGKFKERLQGTFSDPNKECNAQHQL
jgi:hypothetical protein